MPVQVLLAPSADLAKPIVAHVTVEAEYGAFVKEGVLYTAAHHQPVPSPYAGRHVGGDRPSPCNDRDIPVVLDGAVLVSHVDLDTFGGCLRALGVLGLFRPRQHAFWSLAEFVDTRGAHKLGESGASEEDLRRLYAFWAWSRVRIPRYPRDQVTDVTADVRAAGLALTSIFIGDEDLLAAGDRFREAGEDLNRRTFVRREGAVLVRMSSGEFCNHLYVDPAGRPAGAIASYDRATGAVTISLADPVKGVSCRAIVQNLWGPEAGGHEGIAGSPREKDMGEAGLLLAVEALTGALLG